MKNLFLRMRVVAVVVQNNHKHVVGDIKKILHFAELNLSMKTSMASILQWWAKIHLLGG
jgi:hypothetical protein